MIFLFGKDTYRLNQELKKMAINPAVFDFSEGEVSPREVALNLEGNSLFDGETRPVVLKNIFSGTNKESKEKLVEFVDSPLAQDIFLVEYGQPDKRMKLYKLLQQKAEIKELGDLQDFELKQWIQEFVGERQGNIEPQAVDKLVFEVGADLYRQEQELLKLLNYSPNISLANVEKLVQNKLEDNIFMLTDAIANKQKPRALKLLSDQIASGQKELYLLSMLAFAFRNLLLVKDLAGHNVAQPDIVKQTRIHPFVVSKALGQARQFELGQLKKIYLKLVDLDEAIKLGRIEAKQGLELLILGT